MMKIYFLGRTRKGQVDFHPPDKITHLHRFKPWNPTRNPKYNTNQQREMMKRENESLGLRERRMTIASKPTWALCASNLPF